MLDQIGHTQFQLNIILYLMVMRMRLVRYIFHYCDHKKRSFQSKMTRNRRRPGHASGPAGEDSALPHIHKSHYITFGSNFSSLTRITFNNVELKRVAKLKYI